MRARRLPVSRPGDPLTASAWFVLLVLLVGGWLLAARPLWGAYIADARDYRGNAASVANAVSAELMATKQNLVSARIGRGRFSYSLGAADEGQRATVSYFWRGVAQEPPGPADPVEQLRRDGPQGSLILLYGRDLQADQAEPIIEAFERIDLDPAATARRAAVDVPILLRSVRSYWLQDYTGVLDTPRAWVRLIAGLPLLVPLHVAGFIIGLMPGG
jgi:hypothetical protein